MSFRVRTKQEPFPGVKSSNFVNYHSTGRGVQIAFHDYRRIKEMRQRSGWFVSPSRSAYKVRLYV